MCVVGHRSRTPLAKKAAMVGLFAWAALSAAHADPVQIYAAGSLSGAMGALIEQSGQSDQGFAKPVFGPAGLLGERLQNGETADVFASADLAAPARIASSRPDTLVVPFARNRMCVAAKPAVGLTATNVLEKMLTPDLRLATSTPGNDPGGDYALAVFQRAEQVPPGAARTLTEKALHLVGGANTMVPEAGHSPSATIFVGNHADLFLYYCSSAAALLKEVPDLTNLSLPETLEVHPAYGLAVLSKQPEAMRFALFILSTRGQSILAHFGFEPLASSH